MACNPKILSIPLQERFANLNSKQWFQWLIPARTSSPYIDSLNTILDGWIDHWLYGWLDDECVDDGMNRETKEETNKKTDIFKCSIFYMAVLSG